MQESIESSLVRIHSADGHVVGAGFLVGERHILTCAHVVARAFGFDDDTSEQPQAPVTLDVPLVTPNQLLTARVVLWQPQRPDGGDDIAGLELESDPPHGAQAAPLAQVEDLWEHSFRAFGFPRGQDGGVWATGRLLGSQINDWVQIEDTKETGFAVEPGFSGTPVWDPQVEAVVGMVVAAEKRMNLKTAFAIPVAVLVKSWPLLESLIHPFVFLCYARADSELVTRLKADLLSQDIQVWIDREGLQPGTLDWEEALRTAIRAAQSVLLIASPHALSSHYVRDELRIAELYQRTVYLLWVAGTQWMDAVPLGWGGAEYIDARESRYETALVELVELLNKTSSTPARPPELDIEPRNPYKGLRAFTGDDAHDFFGRDTLISELAATLEEALATEEKNQPCARLLAVVGPSGSGKSSVLMAGLLPYLREGKLTGSKQWVYLDPIVPGERPIENLARTLSDHLPYTPLAIQKDLEDDSARGLHLLATKLAKGPETKLVLLVDQFEELFTQTSSEDERRHFLDLLVTAITEPRGPVIVLFTLRADFYDRPLAYPALGQLISSHQVVILPMSIHELREVIEKPAELPDVRLTFEGDLVGDLLFEVQGQAGALPLLQFTLDQLFQQHSGSQLTLSAYREMGGVKGALTKKAEETYIALPSDDHCKLARALFVRLIDPGASEQDTTRRRAALSEFTLNDPTQTRLMQGTIDDFIRARLLTTNEIAGTTTIEVSHEALIREWPRLVEWLREARDDIRLQQTISKDAVEWEQRNKPGDRLYRGTQLKEAQAWARRNTPSGDEVAFLRASATRHMRFVISVMIVVFLLVSTTGMAVWLLLHVPNPTLVTSLNDSGQGSLRQAIDAAGSGGIITFDTSLRGNILLANDDLNIAKDLTIRSPDPKILSISSANSGLVVHVLKGFRVTFSGLTFKDSNLGNGYNTKGFIYNEGTLTLTNSIVSGITGISIVNSGQLTLNHSTVSHNMGTDNYYEYGAIYNTGQLMLNYSTVSHNNSPYGGIYNTGTLTLTNSTVLDNTGGGIHNGSYATLTNSTISDNTGGGIENGSYATLTLTNSTISDNKMIGPYGLDGGGIYNAGMLMLANSTISGNIAIGGAGIYNFGGQATITFCTIYDNGNKTTGNGGGLLIEDREEYTDVSTFLSTIPSQVTISKTIVAGNNASTNPNIAGTITSGGYNLIENVSQITFSNGQHLHDNPVKDLSLLFADSVGLRDNGGPTKTIKLNPDPNNNPAVDRIPLQDCQIKDILNTQSRLYTDQRGIKRPDDTESACDIGAYESS